MTLSILPDANVILPPGKIICGTFKIHSVLPIGFIIISEPESNEGGGLV